MRAAWLVLLFVATALGGCAASDLDEPDPCSFGLCPVDPGMWPDWDLPDGATAILSFEDTYDQVTALTKVVGGWAWYAVVGREHHVEIYTDDGALHRAQLPAGHRVAGPAMAAAGDRVWYAHGPPGAADGGHLSSFAAGDEAPTVMALPTLAYPFTVLAADPVVVRSASALARGEDGVRRLDPSGALVPVDVGVRTLDAASTRSLLVLSQLVDDTPRVMLLDSVTTSRFVVASPDDAVTGVYADERGLGYSTLDPGKGVEETRLWRIDRADHSTSLIGNGWDARFTDAGVFFVGQEPGGGPEVRFIAAGTNSTQVAFYIQDAAAWTNGVTAVWWLDQPRIDAYIVEAGNPTPFVAVLYERR